MRVGSGAAPRFGAVLVVASLACTEPSVERGEPRATAPPPTAAATVRVSGVLELPPLERVRLDYLFEAAERVSKTWPQLSAAEVCVLLVDRGAQWMVRCDSTPPSFTRTADPFRGRPVFAHAGDRFNVSGEDRTTRQLLSETPAAAHVFGLDKQPWLLLGTLEALREFHPAFPPATTEHWLSVAIHELVHVHQLRQPSVAPFIQAIDRQTLHPRILTQLYQRDAAFRGAIEREYALLTAAASATPDEASARAALREWLRSYRRRSARLAKQVDGARLLHDERLFTYLEGVARFVESDFLVHTAQHPASGLAADPQFHDFRAFIGGGYLASPNRQLDSQYYYAIGYHLCVLLERVDPTWHRRVDSEPGWLIGMIERLNP